MIRKLAIVAAVGLGALCAGPATAGAHPLLVTAAPAPGAILPGAPSTLTLAFSEAAVARGSAVTVAAPAGRPLAVGRLKSVDGDRELAVSLPKKLKAGVYKIHSVALGDDGHTVAGDFAFGVSEPNGAPPPGASGLAGVGGGRGGSTGGEGVVSVALRWLGILAASLLWGGALLLAVLRRGRLPFGIALGVASAAAAYELIQAATAGAGGGLDFTLLTAGSGLSALARAVIVLIAGAAFLARRRPEAAGAAGFGVLVSYGLDGHVLAQGSTPAALVMLVHVLAAGAWAGGLIALLWIVRSSGVALRDGVRAFAPVAITGLGFAAVTGAISAIREVNHWYFLWWSAYGRLVIVKVLLVAAASAAGFWTTLRAPALGRARIGPVGWDSRCRGRALRARPGTRPAAARPARVGTNTLVVVPHEHAHRVLVRLVCGCDPRPVITSLNRGFNGTFSAPSPVPTAGTWNAYVTVDGVAADAPTALDVGVSGAPGAAVRNVLSIADLSGPGAARCRAYLVGLKLAIGRLNGAGGVDGGHKAALLALDDAGSPAQAAALARNSIAHDGPVALAPCGTGAEPAIGQAAVRGIPTIAGDPATAPVAGARVFRLAGDPYADGDAIAQAIGQEVLPASVRGVRTVEVVSVPDAQGQRRLEGLRDGLAQLHPGVRIEQVPVSRLTSGTPAQLTALLSRTRTVALVLDATDAQTPALAAAVRRLPARGGTFAPAPILTSERVLSESFIDDAGDAGRLGVVQGTSTVAVDSRDGLTLSQAIPALFPGERASLEALRGYVAALALDDGLATGSSSVAVAARLTRPLPFTDAIAEPWRSDAPAAGTQRLGVLEPTFLSTTLIPISQGGESYSGEYFSDGAWTRPTTTIFGPSLKAPVAPLGAL